MTYFRSFQHVANEYNDTKPINERACDPNRKPYGTSRDIRPINNRNRKWERIQKISDTCYALMCGHTYGDTVYTAWEYKNADPKPDIVASYAPIAWHLVDGKDVVSVSNTHYSQAISHIAFLKAWLPRGMTFINKNGKHFLRVQHGADWNDAKDYSLRNADPDQKQAKYNSHNLKFTSNGDGTFAPYNLPDTATKKPVKRVDTELKRRFKRQLEEFNQWVMTMGPLFPKDWKSRNEYQKQADAYIQKSPDYSNVRVWHIRQVPPELAREALIHPDHPLRMYIGIEAWQVVDSVSGSRGGIKHERKLYRLRSFNNKVFGFEKEVDVDI